MSDIPMQFLGAKEMPEDKRDFPLDAMLGAAVVRPPTFVPDMAWFKRNYQGQQPACGPHSGSHLKALLDFYAVNVQGRKNPRYGWIKLKDPQSPAYDGYPLTDGTDMRSIFKWLKNIGADDFEPLENDVTITGPQYADPAAVRPEFDQNAAQSKISSYGFGQTDYDSLCNYCFQSKAVLLLIKCDEGFWHTTQPTFTTPKYGHFVTMYGYDADGIWVVDSADPDDANALKHIAKQYLTPDFIRASGTAVDLPPSVHQALTAGQIDIAKQILADLAKVLELIGQEIGVKKVATVPSV